MHKNRIAEFLDDANFSEETATFERFEYDAYAGLPCIEPDEGVGEGEVAVIERFVHDPYGQLPLFDPEASIQAGGYDWKYLFQGGRCHEYADLYEHHPRAFDSTPGRWLEHDAVGYVEDTNLYVTVDTPSEATATADADHTST